MTKNINIKPIWKIALAGGIILVLGRIAVLKKVPQTLLDTMARSIQYWESGGDENALNYRNNNPGNLKFAGQPNVVDVDLQGHAIFDTYTNGWKALLRQLEISFLGKSKNFFPDMTLYEFFAAYAEKNTVPYAESVARDLGVSPNDTLQNIAINWG